MQIKNSADIALGLKRYFNENEGYYPIKLDFMKDNEYWMYNPKALRFHFIRLSYVDNHDINNSVLSNINRNLHKNFQGMMNSITPLLNITIGYKNENNGINGVLNYQVDGTLESLTLLSSFYPNILKRFEMRKNQEMFQYKEETKQNFKFNFKQLKSTHYVTNFTITACVIMFFISFLITLAYSNSTNIFSTALDYISNGGINSSIFLGAYYRTFVVANGEFWRFITAGFQHFGIIHLIFNMLALRNIGKLIEDVYGHRNYAIILFVSVIVGSMIAHLDLSTTLVAGLSGGIYGLFAAYVVFIFQSKLYRDSRILSSLITTLMINLLMNFMPSISWAGHFGGFIAGIALAVILYPKGPFVISKSFRINMLVSFVILIGFLGYKCYDEKTINQLYGGTDFAIIEMYNDFHLPTKSLTNNIIELYTKGIE